jgi:hypothetical protein
VVTSAQSEKDRPYRVRFGSQPLNPQVLKTFQPAEPPLPVREASSPRGPPHDEQATLWLSAGVPPYCVATPLRASAAPQQRRVVRPSPAVQR